MATRMNVPGEHEVSIVTDTLRLPGTLSMPAAAQGIVIFVHGSGSSRHSPRNRKVAQFLNNHGFATLLFDMLSPQEQREDERSREHRFNIPLLAGRLVRAIEFVQAEPATEYLPVGLFGASTGAAAALIAAAERPDAVHAVVSRGGRPDLAGDALRHVATPVLLIIGEHDPEVIDLNRHAATRLQVEHRAVIVPGAGHLFEEPGTLDAVQDLAADWFRTHLHAPGGGRDESRSGEARPQQ